jgi:hypothetical protein
VRREEVIDEIWIEVIAEATKAGVFARAARLNTGVKVWMDLHADHHSRVGALLVEALARTEESPSGRRRR